MSELPSEEFQTLDLARLRPMLRERMEHLPHDLRQRARAAEPGSTRCWPLDEPGWFHWTVGFADPVSLGDLHVSSFRKDVGPGSRN